jgi:peptidoglycan/LPS O-acetylase OafA/YrhL
MLPTVEKTSEGSTWKDAELKPTLSASVAGYSSRALKCATAVFRPSFYAEANSRSNHVGRTAYLDGLRGFAALLVYWGHHQGFAHEERAEYFQKGLGWKNQYYFAGLPGIRIIFAGGHFAVAIFFVLSGYVLSSKPLRLIHAYEHDKLGENLASALFRRWLRLYLPVICTTFLFMTFWHTFGVYSALSEPQRTYREELWSWYNEFKGWSFIFNGSGIPWFTYNRHAWTIPEEFKGSIVVFTSLLAFSRCTKNARLLCWLGLMFYFMYIVDGAFCAMFIAGVFLCDLDLLAAANSLPSLLLRVERFKDAIWYVLFSISMYLGGVPEHEADAEALKHVWGWKSLLQFKPQAVYDYKWFYLFWAACFLVSSTRHLRWLKAFFESDFNQYLGRISYAFYLVHGPVLWTLGDRLYAATGWIKESHAKTVGWWINLLPLPKIGPLGLEFGFLVPHLILLPFTFWLAEVVTKLIDEPSMKFSHWAYRTTLGGSRKP